MKLINAIEVKDSLLPELLSGVDGGTDDSWLKSYEVIDRIENIVNEWVDNQPAEKAIPIEWILKRAKLCTVDYAKCLHYLVEAWQTEQKYMVNGQWKFPKDGEKEND